MLDRYLDDLERRLDVQQEQRDRQAWIDFLEDRCPSGYFVPPARRPAPPSIDWPKLTVNQGLADYDAMLLQQFSYVSQFLARGSTRVLAVRCNYGTGILPSLFGCELFMMEDSLDTLPTNRPLGSADAVRRLLDKGQPDIHAHLGGKVFAAAECFLDLFEKRPLLRQNIHFYHPDLQGPIDVAELIWGSDMFYAFYDVPDLIRQLLSVVVETYKRFMTAWYDMVGWPGKYSCHWDCLHRGSLMVRNDSLMNRSPEIYQDFVQPCDQELFDTFGGGVIHFCGRGDHFIDRMVQMKGLYGIQLSQPELNNMEKVYTQTVDKGIKLIMFNLANAGKINRPLRGQVQVLTA